MRPFHLTLLVLIALLVLADLVVLPQVARPRELLLATTTSVRDSGLLDHLLPVFREQTGILVKVTAVGTGQALALGQRGDADVLIVHDPESEEKFISDGWGTRRTPFARNRFLLVGPPGPRGWPTPPSQGERSGVGGAGGLSTKSEGPPGDPAGLRNASSAADAVARIRGAGATFVSRGDRSGTHLREQSLWRRAGLNYTTQVAIASNPWYLSVGSGMGDTLLRAHELRGYTLTDEATYYAYRARLELEPLLPGDDPLLLNVYSVIPVSPGRHPYVRGDLALEMERFLLSPGGQGLIGGYTRNNRALFEPIKF